MKAFNILMKAVHMVTMSRDSYRTYKAGSSTGSAVAIHHSKLRPASVHYLALQNLLFKVPYIAKHSREKPLQLQAKFTVCWKTFVYFSLSDISSGK